MMCWTDRLWLSYRHAYSRVVTRMCYRHRDIGRLLSALNYCTLLPFQSSIFFLPTVLDSMHSILWVIHIYLSSVHASYCLYSSHTFQPCFHHQIIFLIQKMYFIAKLGGSDGDIWLKTIGKNGKWARDLMGDVISKSFCSRDDNDHQWSIMGGWVGYNTKQLDPSNCLGFVHLSWFCEWRGSLSSCFSKTCLTG